MYVYRWNGCHANKLHFALGKGIYGKWALPDEIWKVSDGPLPSAQ